MKIHPLIAIALLFSLLGSLTRPTLAVYQDDASEPTQEAAAADNSPSSQDDELKSALGVRHKRVERMMAEMERKFTTLAESLAENEPERSKRLIETLQTAKQLLLQQRMEEITAMLDDASLDQATDEQIAVIDDIRKLIQMLLNDEAELEARRKEEIRNLERFKKQIENIIKEEFPQERESRKLAQRDKSLADLEAQIKAVEDLIKKQKDVNAKTEQAKAEGVTALERVANDQHKVRKRTEEVEKAIGDQAEAQAGDDAAEGESQNPQGGQQQGGQQQGGQQQGGQQQGGQQQGGQQQGGQQQGGQQQGGQQQGGQQQGGQQQGGQQQGGQQQGGQQQGGQQQGGQQQGGQQQGGQQQGGQQQGGQQGQQDPNQVARPQEPGQAELQKAAQHQKSAEEGLAQGKGDQAQANEKRALDELQNALDKLKKEQRRIATLPPEAFEELAKQQERTESKASDLERQMQEAADKKAQQEGGGEQGGQQGGQAGGQSQSGQQSPGQPQVQKAQQAMKNASQNLEKQDPGSANRQQQKAIDELKQAMREIEDRLAQLREETMEEKLARLEARFTEMLARQQEASAKTRELDEKRINTGTIRRGDRLLLARLKTEEDDISQVAQEAYDLLMEDGTSIVFPQIVEGVRDDLRQVSDLLGERRTDALTQMVQREIEMTLEELIDALKKARRKKQGGGGGGGGGGGSQPLLPKSAELKMLRAAQLRVNRRTANIDQVRGPQEGDEWLKREIEATAERQAEIVRLTEEVLRNQ